MKVNIYLEWCFGLNIFVTPPKKFTCWSPNPQCDGIRRWGFGETFSSWALINLINAFIKGIHRDLSPLLSHDDTMRRQPTVNREDSSFQNYKDACLQFITYGGLLEQPQWSRHIGTILVSFAFWKYSCSRSTFISGKRAECIRQSCGQVFSHLLF